MNLIKIQLLLLRASLTAYALGHSSNKNHIKQTRNHNLAERQNECRLVCDDNSTAHENSSIPDDYTTENPLITPSLHLPQNLSDGLAGLGENPFSIIGVLLNRTGGFTGYIDRIRNLDDVMAFPNSSGVLLSTIENLRNNQNLQLLLQLIGASNSSNITKGTDGLSGWLDQLRNGPSQWQEIFQRAPYLSGIFSTPFGTIFHPFPFNISRAAFSDISNPSEAFTRFADSFSHLPYLSGIFLRPQELWSHLQGLNSEGGNNSSVLFYGPERGYQILQNIAGTITSQGNNLHLPTNLQSFFNNMPFFGNMAKYWNENGIGSALSGMFSRGNDGGISNIYSNIRQILNNQSTLNNADDGSYVVQELPDLAEQWLGNNTSLNLSQLYSILGSLQTAGGPYAGLVANFLNSRSLPNVTSGISDLNSSFNSLEGALSSGMLNPVTPSFIEALNGIRTVFNYVTPPSIKPNLDIGSWFGRSHKISSNMGNKSANIGKSHSEQLKDGVERHSKSNNHHQIRHQNVSKKIKSGKHESTDSKVGRNRANKKEGVRGNRNIKSEQKHNSNHKKEKYGGNKSLS